MDTHQVSKIHKSVMPKKKTTKAINQEKTHSRAKHECPPVLQQLIEVTDLVPPHIELPSFSEVHKKVETSFPNSKVALFKLRKDKLSEDEMRQIIELEISKKRKAFEECFQHFSEEVKQDLIKQILPGFSKSKDHLTKSRFNMYDWFLPILWYEDFRRLREDLRRIADFYSDYRKGLIVLSDEEDKERLRGLDSLLSRKIYSLKPILAYQNEIDIVGMIEKVDLDRLRTCEICNRIFWANRKDSETCSKPCFNILRQRRFREDHREDLRIKKKLAYAKNKKTKNKIETKTKTKIKSKASL